MPATADNVSNAIFKVKDAKIYVPVVTLPTENNVKFSNSTK